MGKGAEDRKMCGAASGRLTPHGPAILIKKLALLTAADGSAYGNQKEL